MTTDPQTTKRWLKVVSFLLFLVFMLAGALGAVTAELFGQFFDAILGDTMIDHAFAQFFQTLPLWIWIVSAVLGLLLSWLVIRIRMQASGGSVPVKTTMVLSLLPVGVLATELFAFTAPTQVILSRFEQAPAPGAVVVDEANPDGTHEGHDHENHEGTEPDEKRPEAE